MEHTSCFYSYKGGTGRTALLARVARELVRMEKRVCCTDFDIEAPGFEAFFKGKELAKSSILRAFLDQNFAPLEKEMRNKLSTVSTRTNQVNMVSIDEFQNNFLSSFGSQELRAAVRNFSAEVLKPNDFNVLLIDNRTGLTARAENLFYFADSIVFVFRPDLQNRLIIKEKLLNYFKLLMDQNPRLSKISVVINLIPHFEHEDTSIKINDFIIKSELNKVIDNQKFKLFKIPFFKEVYYDERNIFKVKYPAFRELAEYLLE